MMGVLVLLPLAALFLWLVMSHFDEQDRRPPPRYDQPLDDWEGDDF